MENKVVSVVLTLTIGVILAGSVLMPVLSDAMATEDTFSNEGYFYLDEFTDEYTFEWDATDPTTMTVNGESFTYSNTSGLTVSLVLGEKFAVRMGNSNPSINFYGNGSYVSTSAGNPTFTLTYSEGSVTATNGTATKTIESVTAIYGIVESGDYVMKKSSAVAYLNSGSDIVADSTIYASGQTYSGNNNIFWHLEGTIDNISYPDTFNSSLTITNETLNGEYSSTHNDLYELTNIQFTATTNTAVVYNVTASYFVVPAEVTAERSVHFTADEIAIIAVIPVIVIVALFIVGVRSFTRNND